MSRATVLVGLGLLFGCSGSSGPGTHNIGDSCSQTADCGLLLACYNEASPGVCSTGCGGPQGCDQNSACATIVTALGNGLCLKTCTQNSDCEGGYTCCGALGNVCTPNARCTGLSPVDTGSTLACPARVVVNGGQHGPAAKPDECQKPVVTTSFPGAQVQVLGPQTVGTTVTFNVPPGTGTIGILQQVVGASAPDTVGLPGDSRFPNAVVPFVVNGPDGGVFYDDDAQPPIDQLPNMEVVTGAPEPACAAMMMPNTAQALTHQDGGYPAGTWSMKVNDIAFECANHDPTTSGCDAGTTNQQYDIQVVTKPVAALTGTVDIGIYVISTDWTAASAIADSSGAWTRFLDTLAGIYAQAGLCLGKVTFYDPPGWSKPVYSKSVAVNDNSPCGLLDQMFTLSQPGGELPLFFVDAITGGQGALGTIVGIDGAIPGPAGAGGTVHSGALVTTADLTTAGCTRVPDFVNCGADRTAYVAAHEGAHYLGLFHTTEETGRLFDTLNDTPRCPVVSCDPAGIHAAVDFECNNDTGPNICGGADYLMFWLVSGASRGVISPQEAQVMRANPIVR
ncbi:MAG TPA: hypothetical protein VGH20_05700 [Myxococcales bacterium]|jgi:hypothetical protein